MFVCFSFFFFIFVCRLFFFFLFFLLLFYFFFFFFVFLGWGGGGGSSIFGVWFCVVHVWVVVVVGFFLTREGRINILNLIVVKDVCSISTLFMTHIHSHFLFLSLSLYLSLNLPQIWSCVASCYMRKFSNNNCSEELKVDLHQKNSLSLWPNQPTNQKTKNYSKVPLTHGMLTFFFNPFCNMKSISNLIFKNEINQNQVW